MARRLSSTDLDAIILLCQYNIDELTDTAAPLFYRGRDNPYVAKAVHLRKLIHTLQIGANLTQKQLEVVYMDALDKSEAYDLGSQTSTLSENPI